MDPIKRSELALDCASEGLVDSLPWVVSSGRYSQRTFQADWPYVPISQRKLYSLLVGQGGRTCPC